MKTLSSKNTVNILIKNMLDAFIGAVSYWALGWALAYGAGGNPFCGGSGFLNYKLPYSEYPKWMFQVKLTLIKKHIIMFINSILRVLFKIVIE